MSEPAEPDHLRIGTRERDAALDLLSEHFAAGRLTADKHAQRTGAALEARTWGELRALLDDLPPSLREQLTAEGILLIDEAMRGSITYRGFRTEQGRLDGRRQASGTVVVTGRRLLVWAAGGKQVDLPVGHPGRAAVTIAVYQKHWLRIDTDAGRFGSALSGRVEYLFRTAHATRIVDLAG